MTGGGLLLTISEHIMIGKTISHDAKAILRGVRHPFIWKKGLWYGITTSCGKDVIMYILSSREMRQKFYQNNDLKLLGLAGNSYHKLWFLLFLLFEFKRILNRS